jgi:hypothetical protein
MIASLSIYPARIERSTAKSKGLYCLTIVVWVIIGGDIKFRIAVLCLVVGEFSFHVVPSGWAGPLSHKDDAIL